MAYSRVFYGPASFGQGVCANCGDNRQHGVRAFLGDHFPNAGAANFSCPQQGDYHEQCASCYDAAAQQWKDHDHQDEIAEFVSGMAPRDWAATLLASVVIYVAMNFVHHLTNFRRLVCGCMDSYDSEPSHILQHFSSSTR